MSESCTLVAVAGGTVYEEYAAALMESAREFFRPTPDVDYVVLPGVEGWPAGTLCRHERLLENLSDTTYVFLVDADMRFEQEVGAIVLPPDRGITATLHPGYITTPAHHLPYERNPDSACAILEGEGAHYFCGGFFGGGHVAMQALLEETCQLLSADAARGHLPRWHDESALNRVLASRPPQRVLDPSFCYPDSDGWYRSQWMKEYKRILVAVDKTATERGDR